MAGKPGLLQEVLSVAHPADNIMSLCHHFCSGRSSTVAVVPACQVRYFHLFLFFFLSYFLLRLFSLPFFFFYYLAQSPSAIALSLLQHIYAP
jgi:hypothetical protein